MIFMNKSKIIKIVLIVAYLILLLIAIFFGYTYAWFTSSIKEGVSFYYDSCDYYKAEHYNTSDVSLYLSKYYYHDAEGKLKIKNMKYISVGNRIEYIKKYISTFLEKIHELEGLNNAEFNYDAITSNDYYLLKLYNEEVLLHYYDVEDNILYIMVYSE